MNAFVWLVALALGITSAVYQISALVAALRVRQTVFVGIAACLLVAFGIIAFGLRNPIALIIFSVVEGFAAREILRRVTRNTVHASQTTRLSAAHLTLLAGSVLFLLPFAWLLSTSLKPDDEQAVFPPVWIPTQQQTTDTIKGEDGLPAKLSDWNPDPGASVRGKGNEGAGAVMMGAIRVAEIADLPSGQVKVRGIAPAIYANQDFTAERADLKKLRHTAPRWENYSEALAYLPAETHYGAVFLGNTLFLTAMQVLGTLVGSSLVAFAFSRLKWPGRDLWFVVLLATMMIPGAVTMMPRFLIFRSLGWIDTLQPLWVPAFFGSAFHIFFLRQFFMSIPTELEDAAKIDGCGPFGVYFKIMLPLVKPALAAIAIMATLGAWNDFQGPLIYLSSPERMPLAYALQLYQSQHGGEPGLLMAASTLVVMPIIVLFFFTQRYFIEGVSLSGLGGR